MVLKFGKMRARFLARLWCAFCVIEMVGCVWMCGTWTNFFGIDSIKAYTSIWLCATVPCILNRRPLLFVRFLFTCQCLREFDDDIILHLIRTRSCWWHRKFIVRLRQTTPLSFSNAISIWSALQLFGIAQLKQQNENKKCMNFTQWKSLHEMKLNFVQQISNCMIKTMNWPIRIQTEWPKHLGILSRDFKLNVEFCWRFQTPLWIAPFSGLIG